MKSVAFARVLSGLGALSAAMLAAGCASKPCADPCAPKPVWVPPHTVTTTCYEVVPARVREKAVADLTVCRETSRAPVDLPVRQNVPVPMTTTALAPVYRPMCVPKIGYAEVQDHVDRLCPRYECACVDKMGTATQVTVGIGWQCGPKAYLDVCEVCRKYSVMEPVVVGQQLVTVPHGSHLEQVQDGCKCVAMHVGADRVPCTIGTRLENRVVGTKTECIDVDHGIEVRERGVRGVPKETLPWTYRIVERQTVVPGFWAYVVDESPPVREPGVITRAEYEEYLRDAAR